MSRFRAFLDAQILIRAERIIARRAPAPHQVPNDARTFMRYLARRLLREGF